MNGVSLTREILLFVLLIVVLLGLMIYLRIQESRRLKKRTIEAMSGSLRAEIELEREENLEKKRKFEEAMKSADGGSDSKR